MTFQIGHEYSRSRDIHGPFGGQRMGGISTPLSVPMIFLFTGVSGEQFGYVDEWSADGDYYSFAGAGQKGDMKMNSVNAAIRDHRNTGKTLHLFTALGKGKAIRYEGEFAYWRDRIVRGRDGEGIERDIIVFDLKPLAELRPTADEILLEAQARRLARRIWTTPPAGVLQPERGVLSQGMGSIKRSSEVVGYVLSAAKGHCELCALPGPFRRPDGALHLEVHHVVQLAHGGPDTPWNAVALCPNCHRRLHFGEDADACRNRLYSRVHRLKRISK